MRKKEIDAIVRKLIEESKQKQRLFSKEELRKRFCGDYSRDQQERICHRYYYVGAPDFKKD